MEHAYCYKCISLSCTTYEGCPIEACPEPGCGVRLHGCKLEDHLSVCWYAVMPCTNATYGCSARLPRHQLAAHLPTCSASVIVCMRHRYVHPGAVKLVLCGHQMHLSCMHQRRQRTNFIAPGCRHIGTVIPLVYSVWDDEVDFLTSMVTFHKHALRHHYRARNWTFVENHFLVSS